MKQVKTALAMMIALTAFGVTASTQTVVSVEGDHEVVVARAPGDNLEEIASTEVCFGPEKALAGCAPWDIKENCCPAGCAAKNGSNWAKADDILRGCMRGLGCSEDETNGATVFMKCDCDK